MPGIMPGASGQVEASCAICGAPPYPECPHEGEALEKALTQAMHRWGGWMSIREWVLNHARNQIIAIFHDLRSMRMDAHAKYLQSLPYYSIYHRFNGAPPLSPQQLHIVHQSIDQANRILQNGVDQDWRTACLQYPTILDYYFNLVSVRLPPESDPAVRDPRFGEPNPRDPPALLPTSADAAPRRVKERRDESEIVLTAKRSRRRSRGAHSPPPAPPSVPMPGSYR